MVWQKWFNGAKPSAVASLADKSVDHASTPSPYVASAWLLEPRMLFDGAIAATVSDTASGAAEPAQNHAADAPTHESQSDTSEAAATADPRSTQQQHSDGQSDSETQSSDAANTAGTPTRHEVVFIDTSLKNYQTLVEGIQPGVEIVLIDGKADGLQQIADWAATHSGYDAIHIFSHGSEGTVNLGSTVLNDSSIKSAEVQAALAKIGQALTGQGDLLLYGCDVGAGGAGDALLADLAAATGADIAASSDATGSSLLGGDWVLEKTVGDIDTAALHVDGYQDVLAVLTFSSDQDDVASGANLSVVRTVDGQPITFATDSAGYLGLDSTFGTEALYSYDGASGTSATRLTITAPSGYTFDLSGLSGGAYSGTLHFVITRVDGSTASYDVTVSNNSIAAISGLPVINDVTKVVISSDSFSVQQNFNIVDVRPIAPAVTSVGSSTANGAYKAGDTVLVSVNFSSAVTVNTSGGTPTLQLETGSIDRQAVYVSGSGSSTLVFSYLVQNGDQSSDLNYVSTGALSLNGSTITDSNNASATLTLPALGAATSLGGAKAIVIDTQLPTSTVSISDTVLSIGETATVTITFSEAVSGFTNSDLTVANGTLSAVSSADGGRTWTATFTPTNNIADSTNVISLDMTGVQDVAGNTGSGSVNSANYAIDTQRPTATIVVADNDLKAGETSLVTITFSEAITGFTLADISAANGTLMGLSSSDGGMTWTATLTPNSGLSDATNVVTLTNSGVTDLSGNAGTGTTESNNYSVVTQRPTATIVVADSSLTIGETSLVTITFSEAVTGFTNADLSVSNGTLSAVSSSDGGITWTATLTPGAGTTDTSNLIVLDNSGVANASGNAGVGTTASNNYAIDTQRPTATIVLADNALAIGETSLVTITFSEAVTNFSPADLTVENGTLSGLSSSDGGITWTATFTPAAGITDATNLITLDNSGVSDLAGNVGTGITASGNYSIDSQRPTATITMADTALKAGESSLVTIAFSEAVTGFTNSDLIVPNGTLSAVSSSDGGITWTATYTPNNNVSAGSNVISLDSTGVQDLAGNSGAGSVDSGSFAVNTQRPTATVVVADSSLAIGETSLVTITFSEAVTGFTNADLSVSNGTLSAVSSADGGITWNATFTPDAGTTDTSNLIVLDNSGVANASGNAGVGTTASNHYAIDTLRPTATIVLADNALAIGETSLVTITFSEAVTNFSTADLTVDNGTLSGLSSSDGGITWTATFTPAAGITDATNLITLNNSGVIDLAGNAGTGTTASGNYSIDSQRPTATVVVADNDIKAGETSLVTITFSEAVTGFTLADISAANGTLSDLNSADGGITWTATLTPDSGLSDATNVVTLNNSGVADLAGNTGTGSTDSNNYSVATQRPTANVVLAETALKAGETSLVTITFSEAVTGFTNADLSVSNGTLSAVSSADGGVTWTATFTPAAGTTAASNLIVLDNSGVANASGNAGVGTSASNSYAIDTARPTASVVVSNPVMGIGASSQVTITFTEAVSGFDLSDLTIANGTLSNLISVDGGVTWTATLTPNPGVTDASNQVMLDTSRVTDSAGNQGVGTVASNNYALDAAPPIGTIKLSDTQLTAGETARVTITFSEAVTGFTNDDLTVSNGTLSAVTSSDGGITWTAIFTPAAGVVAAVNQITLDNSGVSDLAGNAGTGSVSSPGFTIDTRPAAAPAPLPPVTQPAGNPQFMVTDGQPGGAVPPMGTAPRTQVDMVVLPAAAANMLAAGSGIFTPAAGVNTTPSAAIIFRSSAQSGGVTESSMLAGVFSQNGVNHYEPGVVRAQPVDFNQSVGGRSTLAGMFSGINLPGSTTLEVFSGSSWQSVGAASFSGAVAPTSVFGAPVFSQQLQWLDKDPLQQIASLEAALNNKPAV